MWKRLLSAALAAALLLSMVVTGAAAQQDGLAEQAIGKLPISAEYLGEGLFSYESGDRLGLITETGKIILDADKSPYYTIYPFSEGYALFHAAGSGREGAVKSGYLDVNGQEHFTHTDSYGYTSFHDGTAAIGNQVDFKASFIDKSGNALFTDGERFHSGEPFYNDRAVIIQGVDIKSYAVVNRQGNLVVDWGTYFSIRNYSDGMAAIVTHDRYQGAIDADGRLVVPAIYDFVGDFREGYCVATKNGKHTLLDKTGREVVPRGTYSRLGAVSEGMAVVGNGTGVGYIDTTGKVVVPLKYKDAEGFFDGMALVSDTDYNRLYIDKTGRALFGRTFQYAESFQGGRALVQLTPYDNENKLHTAGIINTKGEVLASYRVESMPTRVSDDRLIAYSHKDSACYVLPIPAADAAPINPGQGTTQPTPTPIPGPTVSPKPGGPIIIWPTDSPPSEWAKDELVEAVTRLILPDSSLPQTRLQDPITRMEFCNLSMTTLGITTGTLAYIFIPQMPNLPEQRSFSDMEITPTDLRLCRQLGIVSGDEQNRFRPDDPITRQEAAKMIYQLAKALDAKASDKLASSLTYQEDIPDWAQEGVRYVTGTGLMNGVGDNRFDPMGTYTWEQAVLTMNRLCTALGGPGGYDGSTGGPVREPVTPPETPTPTEKPLPTQWVDGEMWLHVDFNASVLLSEEPVTVKLMTSMLDGTRLPGFYLPEGSTLELEWTSEKYHPGECKYELTAPDEITFIGTKMGAGRLTVRVSGHPEISTVIHVNILRDAGF